MEQEDLIAGLCEARYESIQTFNNYYHHNQAFLKKSQYENVYQEYKNKLLSEIKKSEDRIKLLNSDRCNTHNSESLKKLNIRVSLRLI
jgi:hypothetical protein